MKNSLHYFKVSQESPEDQLDINYFILEKDPYIKEYITNVKNIKETLITIKKLKENKENKETVDKYYKKLFEDFNDYSNCSELGCFVNACDTTRDLIKNDFDSFKKITDLFIKKRILDDKAPENWIQAIIDTNASRKKGKLGENKLIAFLTKDFGYKLVKTWEDFDTSKKCVCSFSKDVFYNDEVAKRLGINLKTKNQGKMLDLIIKNGKNIYILEAKHLNTGGGEQNKQIDELIKILELKETKENVFYVSFLDGTYSNKLIGENIQKKSKKLFAQRSQIEKYLKNKGAKNYWVNTTGFIRLFMDLG
ncbi:MAG: hypothetical protein PHR57_00805 [Patescibacteria group bacterium]|nr:hypothetical protein [Patescibacteria group bacterium]